MKAELVAITSPLGELAKYCKTAEDILVYIARVSNPSNQQNVETGGRLLRYCLENGHWSVLEAVSATFQIQTSRAIAAQILRHRSFTFQEFCLAGDSLITLKLPSGNTYKREIQHLYKLQRLKNQHITRNGLPLARVFDGEKFTTARIKEVFKTGIKPCFKITMADGKSVTSTKDHKFLTKDGYLPLEEIVGLTLAGKKAVMSIRGVIATNGVLCYRDHDWLAERKAEAIAQRKGLIYIAESAGMSYHTIRKQLKNNGLSFTKEERASMATVWNKGKFGYKIKPHTLETIEKMRASAKRGADSNLYRGGTDTKQRSERLKIADWCATIRAEKFIESAYHCKECSSNARLELDHIHPVYSHPELAYEKSNIQVLCRVCHQLKHNINVDRKIWGNIGKGNTLTVKWQQIVGIEYVGEIETYDLEVDHDTHNYVANGIVVHNSQRYSAVTAGVEPVELRMKGSSNRQGSLEVNHDAALNACVTECLLGAIQAYEKLLENGVAPECARAVLPLSTSTSLYMTGSIRSWVTYFMQRCSPHAQKEHRLLALQMRTLLASHLPMLAEVLLWNKLD